MKRKILSTILLIILIIATLGINTFGANEGELINIEIKFDTESLSINKEQKTVEFMLSLGEFKGIEENIVLGYEATFEYDTNMFESAKVEGLNGWSVTYEPSTKVLIGETPTAVGKANTNITKITLTLKDGLEAGTKGVVALNNLTLTDGGDNDFSFSSEITLSIAEDTQEENENTNTNTDVPQQNSNTNTIIAGNKTDSTTATTKTLPSAGIRNILIIGIIIAITAMIIFKIKSKDIKY